MASWWTHVVAFSLLLNVDDDVDGVKFIEGMKLTVQDAQLISDARGHGLGSHWLIRMR